MIRRDDGTDWLLLTQPDHAALSGIFAERWGSTTGPFAPVRDRAAVLYAARGHDNGWTEWEAAPTVDAAGRPRHFLEMPVGEVLPIWRRGPQRAAEYDPYSGILVSFHATRIFQPRYEHGRDAPDDRESLKMFLEEQEALRSHLRRQVTLDERTLLANSALIGLWDRLSLLLCCGPIPPTVLGAVPTREGSVDIQMVPQGERSAVLRPYPFSEEPFCAEVPARRIPARGYPTDQALRRALAEAPTESLRFLLNPA